MNVPAILNPETATETAKHAERANEKGAREIEDSEDIAASTATELPPLHTAVRIETEFGTRRISHAPHQLLKRLRGRRLHIHQA